MARRSNEWLEAFASSFREQYGIAGLHCPDIDMLLDRVASDQSIALVRRFDDEMPDEEASADAETRTIYYRETLRYRLRAGDKVARFIFLEELGRILLGHTGVRHRSLRPKIHEKTVAQVRIEESEARYFAASVIAPISRISPEWDALKISQNFQLSLIAAEIRKEEADKARRIQTGKNRRLPECAIDFLKEARSRGYQVKTIID